MTRLTWCSDVHLEFLSDESIVRFSESLASYPSDGIVLTGDISNASKLVYHLSVLERIVSRRVFFVLGNHDYWGSSVENVRKKMHELHNVSQYMKYLSELSYVPVSPVTAVIGHDGWYDAIHGNWQTSNFGLNDWNNVHDFISVGGSANRASIVGVSRKLSLEAATSVMNSIKAAVRYHKNIVILTHVPPVPSKLGDADGVPWFTSKLMGDCLIAASRAYPDVKFTVLCGHQHAVEKHTLANNMIVHVAGATYGSPAIAEFIDVP